MLQRAASNACSWWWASHIRTKQSKWLEQCLQDMEEKVHSTIKLIEEDGDSFAKRAEMYYKRRPEIINAIEESYRSFKALADRYDMLSKELQNANHTIATVFPEQVQFTMDGDDDCQPPKTPILPMNPGPNIPNVPKAPIENLKGLIHTASKKLKAKKTVPKPLPRAKVAATSGLSKEDAFMEIDKINKEILVLQTIKEFVKSSYESGLAKYWEIEKQIMEKQDKVCKLQDEFEVETVIEDNEARTLMAEAALKSCQETLAALQEKQDNATREAREEYKKVEHARELLQSLKNKYMKEQLDEQMGIESHDNEGGSGAIEESKEDDNAVKDPEFRSLTVTELAEKIDELVSKVINLETAVSSQTALIDTLRTEADELHSQLKNLENENETLMGDAQNLSIRVRELEDKLSKIQNLNKNVESQRNNLHTNFAQALSSLDRLSEKLSGIRPDDDVEAESPAVDTNFLSEPKLQEEIKDENDAGPPSAIQKNVPETKVSATQEVDVQVEPEQEVKQQVKKSVTFLDEKPIETPTVENNTSELENGEAKEEKANEVDDVSWQQMLLSGTEDREKILLQEYTTILRNYKDVKKKLNDTEKKDKDMHFDMMVQMKELKEAILKKDQQIHHLQQKLNHVQLTENEGGPLLDSSRDENMDPEFKDDHKEDEVKLIYIDGSTKKSPIEEKLRGDIDVILDENLDFWLRFSTSYHEVQKFKSEVKDLQDEISKLSEKKKQEGSATNQLKSEARPIYKHLREIQTELSIWLERTASLKDELKRRFNSICTIQEEITRTLSDGVEEGLSSHQAAKLQGEILNMKQENNKVREELQSCFDHVGELQLKIEKTVTQMNEEFAISTDQPQLKHSMSRAKVPLRSFIFGTRAKKQKHSLFSFIHQNRKVPAVRAGVTHSNGSS